jgi:hypothetical protein
MKRYWLAAGLLALTGPAVFAGDSTAQPDVGKDAPELQTKEWINSEGRTTLADMKGEVVVLANWKTG